MSASKCCLSGDTLVASSRPSTCTIPTPCWVVVTICMLFLRQESRLPGVLKLLPLLLDAGNQGIERLLKRCDTLVFKLLGHCRIADAKGLKRLEYLLRLTDVAIDRPLHHRMILGRSQCLHWHRIHGVRANQLLDIADIAV